MSMSFLFAAKKGPSDDRCVVSDHIDWSMAKHVVGGWVKYIHLPTLNEMGVRIHSVKMTLEDSDDEILD